MTEGAGFSRVERRAASGLSAVFACRMLGLFMVLPVLSVYADAMPGATPLLIGLALGVYGLMQGLLQVPFGILSDRLGRKPVITAGLLIFIIGSVIAALADDIVMLVVGRALQGGGAVAAAVMALAADLSRERNRTVMMAILGGTIGLAFMLSLVLGPVLAGIGGLGLVFWVAAGLGALAIVVLQAWVPAVSSSSEQLATDDRAVSVLAIAKHPELWRLDVGVFVLHAMMTAVFIGAPLALRDAGVAGADQWQVFLPAVFGAVLVMLPLVYAAERKGLLRGVFLLSITGLGVVPFIFGSVQSVWALGFALAVFFGLFSALEAMMPSRVSKVAQPAHKGTALGLYASSQFFGAFVGGAVGGLLYGAGGALWLYGGCTVLAAVWWGVACGMSSAPPAVNRAAASNGGSV